MVSLVKVQQPVQETGMEIFVYNAIVYFGDIKFGLLFLVQLLFCINKSSFCLNLFALPKE